MAQLQAKQAFTALPPGQALKQGCEMNFPNNRVSKHTFIYPIADGFFILYLKR